MTPCIWTDLCKQPTQPVSTEKYAQLVHDSTIRLHEPIHSILSALNERVIGLTKLANFEAALRDTQVMQQLSPASPCGYLCEATVYKEQGKQLQVIDICNKGLDVVDPKDNEYATLQQIKADAMQRQNTRVDFITKLPFDIVTTMLFPMFVDDDSPLDASTPCPYLHVCNKWRDSILQYSNGLRFETGYKEEQADPQQRWQLATFARHIKALHLRRYSKGPWLSDLLRDNDFCSLRELHIGDFWWANIDHFVPLMQSIGSTLTHLSIHEVQGINILDTFPLAEVLSSCPNLVSFAMCHPDDFDFRSLPMAPWSNMTALTFTLAGGVFTRDHITSICQRFPALKKLDLFPCADVASVHVIPQYCPLLKSVQVEIQHDVVGLFYSDHSVGHEELAVTKLSIFTEEWDDDGLFESTCFLLRQHRRTLEDIQWTWSPERNHRELYNIQYPRLKKLSIHSRGWWILRNAPMVEELSLASPSIINNPEVLDTIPPNLKTLELRLDQAPLPVDERAIKDYLDRVCQQCRLHELAIQFDIINTFCHVRDAICRFNTLRSLMMGFPEDWHVHEMERFLVDLVIACPHLSSLEINCTNAPTTYSITALKQLQHLKQLTFSIKDTDGYDSFWHAIETFSQLKRIRIYHANHVSHVHVVRLRKQRRDMKIIVDNTFKRF
ncbi:hypothetical protein O0I10_006665 [Lichtheimia ornata]|uniref:F-box domain-containing protein n=1 Tax=Lichtheimia ornata TaxID=688661 RepID=A0AAD7V313_9FUNG|nr:uncharacterized protein O0I10_006665 [Lichtheimia ornata]KAJ8657601.1 hypothetical protein O0I10_006665 [Lichtheimia ornata]